MLYSPEALPSRTARPCILVFEGYDVATATSSAEGLAALRRGGVDFLLTDQRMPGGSGTDMLTQAQREGLLGDLPVLVLTANYEDPALAGWRVLRKPVDLDRLVDLLHEAFLHGNAGDGIAQASEVTMTDSSSPGARRSPRARLALVLYVSATSAASRRAQRNLERLLVQYPREEVSLDIVDLSLPGNRPPDEDRVTYTPTLVKRAPAPRAWFIGDLRNIAPVQALLEDAGVEKVR
jgi:CheY-like chemotaxis protein